MPTTNKKSTIHIWTTRQWQREKRRKPLLLHGIHISELNTHTHTHTHTHRQVSPTHNEGTAHQCPPSLFSTKQCFLFPFHAFGPAHICTFLSRRYTYMKT
ncbi:hypothetical protein, unlikely [Trypanosoma brucei gambiense DAL972]|uniref:Uncharacterized protein n=1 Tax=Trypanosoma brucei gambiense (strain MHOM/CI/86/DAL972) TaxID=679716 RepID=D0A9Y7_TRYB9|nr:hypothetical protein, unlikely [Trypanosoma brucei gambiense DAL972]CBH18488.1 hypothetical protein, unlikely [Trypanosoma brucei gambiense DAL972]|eukprot:XP_011780752.1 hypothetical protein, unlikely [Trypanosoma brucei gambiense DAL972]